ncbi:hypothetical protein JHS3_22390 [Jeongeupia sp. HS-3]|uniref:GNAT family N-acetyltransferase n=1 Tax=Jeongeupia sp. HS-3 TaxID=1009682 RepID=UPI0018A5771E|nr:GNAT family protein [Jeongeupia sp. HS-3]BCL76503.1 hypothetical protein JHS3_22390 [Jeongeupia sp. HS-3]
MISLRMPAAPDAPFWAGLRAEPSAQAFMPFVVSTLVQLGERLVNGATPIELDREHELLRVVCDGDERVGLIGARQRSSTMRTVELSVHIAESHRRRGFGVLALEAWINELFEAGYRRLWATVSVDNHASCALWGRLGFTQEGVLRKHYLIGEREVDQLIYGLLRSESMAAQQSPTVFKEV